MSVTCPYYNLLLCLSIKLVIKQGDGFCFFVKPLCSCCYTSPPVIPFLSFLSFFSPLPSLLPFVCLSFILSLPFQFLFFLYLEKKDNEKKGKKSKHKRENKGYLSFSIFIYSISLLLFLPFFSIPFLLFHFPPSLSFLFL